MTRTAVISQPTYLPWLGYLRLVAAADVFVFLDDVQFARRSWQSRNRILGPAGELMLTVPVRKADRSATIAQIMIVNDGERWWQKHLASIRHAYADRPGFAEGYPFLETVLRREEWRLADFNAGLIEELSRQIGLTAEFARASELGCGGTRSEHLLAICRAVGATEYVSTTGSENYMAEDGAFEAAGFPVRFVSYTPAPYPQGREPFTPYMSFVDALMNIGWDGLRRLVTEPTG